MNRVKQLDGKKLERAIRHGATPDSLCREYDCSVTQLERQISQIYHGRAGRVQPLWKALHANSTTKAIRAMEDEEVAGETLQAETDSSGEQEAQLEAERKQKQARAEAEKREADIRRLSETEKRLSAEIAKLDDVIADAEAKYSSCEENLRAIERKIAVAEDNIREAERLLQQKYQKREEISGILAEKFEKLESAETRHKQILEALSEVQDAILELTQVVLGVDTETEEIVIVDDSNLSGVCIDTDGSEEVLATLLSNDECDNLRLKDLKLLALTLAVAHNIPTKVKIFCDDTEFVEMFERFV